MKKFAVMTLAALMACALLVGCSSDPKPEAILESTATPTPARRRLRRLRRPLPPPPRLRPLRPEPTPSSVEEMDGEVIDAGFDELYKKSDYVVIGTLTKSLGEWNQARKPDGTEYKDIYMMEKQYTISVSEVLRARASRPRTTSRCPCPTAISSAAKRTTRCASSRSPAESEMLFF